jgi:hypothetical protein
MTQEHDNELRELWTAKSPAQQSKGEEMLALVERKSAQFDRTIRWRNLRECVAAPFIAGYFGWLSFHQPNLLSQIGCLWTAASSLWILYYILRHGKPPAAPEYEQSLNGYREQLRHKYDHQLQLFKSLKYWYLLPPYLGLLMFCAGQISHAAQRRALGLSDLLGPAAFTAMFALIWWLNEGPGVRCIEKARRALEDSET